MRTTWRERLREPTHPHNYKRDRDNTRHSVGGHLTPDTCVLSQLLYASARELFLYWNPNVGNGLWMLSGKAGADSALATNSQQASLPESLSSVRALPCSCTSTSGSDPTELAVLLCAVCCWFSKVLCHSIEAAMVPLAEMN